MAPLCRYTLQVSCNRWIWRSEIQAGGAGRRNQIHELCPEIDHYLQMIAQGNNNREPAVTFEQDRLD